MSACELYEGWRNNGLTSYAGSLRARGFGAAEILEALREANQTRCATPLPDMELRNIAKSAAKWKPYGTYRGGEWPMEHAVYIPRGCFDPRPAVCGFEPAAIVEGNVSLGLWRNHKALYAYLAGLFGPWGCHPAQRTIAEKLGIQQQHVARHVRRLERAGLLLVEGGAYRHAERRYACNSYHFLRHTLFAEHFTRRGLPVFSDLAEFPHRCDEFSTGPGESLLENQEVTGILTRRGVVEPITGGVEPVSRGGDLPQWVVYVAGLARLCEERRAKIPPFDFETAGFFRSCLGPDKGQIIHYSTIVQYIECAAGCGGARVVHTDGTVRQYGCSCEVARAAESEAAA